MAVVDVMTKFNAVEFYGHCSSLKENTQDAIELLTSSEVNVEAAPWAYANVRTQSAKMVELVLKINDWSYGSKTLELEDLSDSEKSSLKNGIRALEEQYNFWTEAYYEANARTTTYISVSLPDIMLFFEDIYRTLQEFKRIAESVC